VADTLIKEAVRAFLLDQTTVTDSLATYRFADGQAEAPAIFTTDIFPDDVRYPAIIVRQVGGNRFGCRDTKGMDATIDVIIYANKLTNADILDALADVTWLVLERAALQTKMATVGWEEWGVRAAPPQIHDDPDEYPGRLIQLSVRALRA